MPKMLRGENQLSYCGHQVRKHDRDRFLTALFAPETVREGLFALYAYNYEIARTREVVTETMIGQMRLQFWRDALKDMYDLDTSPRHEVAEALFAAIRKYDLPRKDLERLIYAREFDLEDIPPTTMTGLETYAEETTAPLMRLALCCLGLEQELETECIRHAAIAYAFSGLLRAVPYHAGQRRLYLPSALIKKHNISQAHLFAGDPGEGLVDVVSQVVSVAWQHLDQARSFLRKKERYVLKKFAPVMGWIVLAEQNLALLEKCGCDVFSRRFANGPFFSEIRLWWQIHQARY